MAKKTDSFPISAKWVYIYSLSGVNLKATNGQIFSLPSGFFALSRDEIQKFFTNNYITVEYDDEDIGFTLFCYDFAVVGIQPASDITMAGLVQVSSDTNLQVKKIVGSADEIKALVDSISGALSSLSGVVSDTDTKVDVIGGNTTAANALLSDLKTELTRVYTVCETIANADPDTVLVEIDENIGKIQDNTLAGNSLLTDLKTALGSLASVVTVINSLVSNLDYHASNLDTAVDAIGGNTTAANSLLQNIKDEITKAYTACESLIAGQGVGNSSLSAIDGNLDTLNTSVSSINTFVDAIGANSTAANSLLSDLKDELTKVYTVCQSILEKGVDSTVTDIDTKVDAIGASVVALNTTASGSKDELTKIYTACQTIMSNQTAISTVLSSLDTKVTKLVESSESIISLLGVMNGISENLFTMNSNIEILIRTLNTVSAGVQLIANNSEMAEVVNVGQLQAVYNSTDKCFEVRGIPSTATKFEGSFVFQNNRFTFSRPNCNSGNVSIACPYLPFVTFNFIYDSMSLSVSYSSGSFSIPVRIYNDLGGLIDGVSFDFSAFVSSISDILVGVLWRIGYTNTYPSFVPDMSFLSVSFVDDSLVFSCDLSGSFSCSLDSGDNSSSCYFEFDNSTAISFSN